MQWGLALIILVPVGYLLILSLSPEPDVQAGNLIPSRLIVDNSSTRGTSSISAAVS